MRLQNIILAYFLIGATMWAGGAIGWDEAGIGQEFADVAGADVDVNESQAEDLDNSGGVLQEVTESLVGGLAAGFGLLSTIIGYLFWPITVLTKVSAPVEAVVLLGGVPTVSFYAIIVNSLIN